jgi:hypothetical protein
MAPRRFGISRGETPFQVLEAVGAAVVSDEIELTVDLANLSTAAGKEKVLLGLNALEQYIQKVKWPPA